METKKETLAQRIYSLKLGENVYKDRVNWLRVPNGWIVIWNDMPPVFVPLSNMEFYPIED